MTNREETSLLLNEILDFKDRNNKNIVSLYTLSEMMKLVLETQTNIQRELINNIEKILKKDNYGDYLRTTFYDFDYLNKKLILKDYDKKIIFSKDALGLYLEDGNNCNFRNVFLKLKDCLTKAYDGFMSLDASKNESSLRVLSTNSDFLVDIHSYEIRAYLEDYNFDEIFEISSRCFCGEYDGNFELLRKQYDFLEEEYFKRIFVKISDCPKWCQKLLYELRADEIRFLKQEESLKRKAKIKKYFGKN